MDRKSIAKSNNIEIIWVDKQYSETGSYIPKCTLYPNGAIVLPKKLKELEIEFVALHEIGHVVTGRYLVAVNERLRHLEQCKNEANVNRFMLHNIVKDFIEQNDNNRQWATPHRLCEFLNLASTFENIQIAQEEIDFAFYETN